MNEYVMLYFPILGQIARDPNAFKSRGYRLVTVLLEIWQKYDPLIPKDKET